MREAVSFAIKVMSLYFLVEKVPDLLQILGTYSSIGTMEDSYTFYIAASIITIIGICVILFFTSGGLSRMIVSESNEKKLKIKFSKKAVYISAGIVLTALNLPHVVDLVFGNMSLYSYGFREAPQFPDNSVYYFVSYGIILLLSGILIKIGVSCEE